MRRGHRRFSNLWLTPVCLLLLAQSWLPTTCDAQDRSGEYAVKAAFLLNFAKFTEWPSSAFAAPQSPVEICLMGNDPFGEVLDEVIENQTVNGRKLLIRRIGVPPSPQTCQVLFVNSQLKNVKGLIDKLEPGTLTVSDGSRFLQEGGVIALVLEERRIRFDINQKAAERHGLKLSSRLLSVARSVTK